jgi:26S proteasome regulatory subunit T1
MPPKADWEKYKKTDEDKKNEDKIVALDEGDIQLLKTYGQGPYAGALKSIDNEIKEVQKRVNEKMGVKESDTGLAPPNLWDLKADEERMRQQPLQVARCTKIIKAGSDKPKEENGVAADAAAAGGANGSGAGQGPADTASLSNRLANFRNGLGGDLGALGGAGGPPAAEEQDKYVINVKQIAKFVVALGDRVAPTDIEEGMRVG